MSMEPVRRTSADLTAQHIRRLAELFPSVITETRDDEGGVRPAVDFDLLRQELSDHVVEGPQERYQLDWPGKRSAAFAANAPTTATLRPDREESVDFDTTKNVFIEGDNLEVLKVLQESYLGKVKMIYIDPPYNTGNDFVYNDDFAESTAEYLKKAGDVDEDGARLRANPETNGRFHSDWLSMMYPRLKLARNLLANDGIIFLSIDDHEFANLKLVMSEVFGADNFFAEMVVIRSEGGGLAKRVIRGHDMLVGFTRDSSNFRGLYRAKDIRGERITMDGEEYWIETDWLREEFGKYGTLHYENIEKIRGKNKKIEIDAGLASGKYRLISQGNHHIVGRLRKISEDGTKFHSVMKHLNKNASIDMDKISMRGHFDNPKPLSLLTDLIGGATRFTAHNGDIIMDFFAGSGTTGEAVVELNAADAGNRRFVLVQLPERPAEKSEAARQGYPTVSAVTRERLRRASRAAAESFEVENLDTGFRAFRLDASPFAEKAFMPENTTADLLAELEDPILADRTPEDLLTHVLLAWGLDLAVEIQTVELAGQEVFDVEDGALLAAFSGKVTNELAEAMARREPARAVFLDSGFASDAARINVEQIFREISPVTDVKVL